MSLFEHKNQKTTKQQQQNQRQNKKYESGSSLFSSKDPGYDSDEDRPFLTDQQREGSFPSTSRKDCYFGLSQTHLHALVLTMVSAFTRFYRIGRSSRVIWDEAHFGKFGAYYVNHTFYHDVHPPLAKMLVGLSEILTGFDGSFTFTSGQTFPADVNYTFMRAFNASFGVPLAPMAYLTLRNLGCSPNTALLGGLLVCFDNALCTISRFILLDAMLLCFTAMSVLSLSGLYKHRRQPFTVAWVGWLVATGVSLGLVLSAKWVGLFAVALVGFYTLYELYDLFGQKDLQVEKYIYHWAYRIVALIGIPMAIYMLCFRIHFGVLYKSGPGDAEMSSLFQANLEGTGFRDQPLDVAYGSKITIKSAVPGVGLLHSHPDTYPEGSKQQQITGYTHKDQNNDWIVKKIHGQTYGNTTDTVEFIRNGDIVRLMHDLTTRNLHSHTVASYSSKRDYEVSGYGVNETYPDPNDHWRVEVVEELSRKNPEHRLRALSTRFRLRHVSLGCVLRATKKSLPQWAWSQAEIVCSPRRVLDDGTIWNIEAHTNPLLPKATADELRSPFLKDFIRLNMAMARTNNALVPDLDKIDTLTSAPYEWPIMRLGLRMCGWGDNDVKFWLTGNPAVWWLSTLAVIVVGPVQMLYYAVRHQRGLKDFAGHESELEQHLWISGILWGGWALHYLPFFLMGRVTYLHHYFPALYFAAMYLAYLIQWNTRHRGKVWSYVAMGSLAVVTVGIFCFFAPFTFGFDYPAIQLASRKWISTWNIYDVPTTKL